MPCAVVDFLFHPAASFWADHHSTSFLTDSARSEFHSHPNPRRFYDESADSCAGLIQEHLEEDFGYRNPDYDELVRWADKTDAARYETVEEAIFPTSPALIINLTLAQGRNEDLSRRLVRGLRTSTLVEVAAWREIRTKYAQILALLQSGLNRFKQSASIVSGIVKFDVNGEGTIISRYAPYYFFPRALYSAGVVRSSAGSKITVMRNPWLNFQSPHLGKICEKYGGGGHQRIGGILLPKERAQEASSLLNNVVADIVAQGSSKSTKLLEDRVASFSDGESGEDLKTATNAAVGVKNSGGSRR